MAMSLRIYGMGRALRGTFMSGRKGARRQPCWTKVNNIIGGSVKSRIDTVWAQSGVSLNPNGKNKLFPRFLIVNRLLLIVCHFLAYPHYITFRNQP